MLAERDIIFQKKINKIADQQKIIMQTQGSSLHSKLFSGQDEQTLIRLSVIEELVQEL